MWPTLTESSKIFCNMYKKVGQDLMMNDDVGVILSDQTRL